MRFRDFLETELSRSARNRENFLYEKRFREFKQKQSDYFKGYRSLNNSYIISKYEIPSLSKSLDRLRKERKKYKLLEEEKRNYFENQKAFHIGLMISAAIKREPSLFSRLTAQEIMSIMTPAQFISNFKNYVKSRINRPNIMTKTQMAREATFKTNNIANVADTFSKEKKIKQKKKLHRSL